MDRILPWIPVQHGVVTVSVSPVKSSMLDTNR